MTPKETIRKRYDTVNETNDVINTFIIKWCGANASHLLDSDDNDGQYLRDFFNSRDIALLSAFKADLRDEIEKRKIPMGEMQHDLKGRCDFEKNNTLNEVLALIKETKT